MHYIKITLLSCIILAFVGTTQAQSKKEIAQRLANAEQKLSSMESSNKRLIDSIAELDDKMSEMDTHIQMLNDKIGQLASMVEGLSTEVKKAAKVNENQGGGTNQVPVNHTKIKFDKDTFDFGEIKEGKVVTHLYTFKNTGDKPLKIESARGSCGCTVPEWPKGEIAPGKSAEIKVVFNSKGKRGPQHKTVAISANTNPTQTVIHIKGIVQGEE